MDTGKLFGQNYKPRVIDSALERALGTAGAVVIEGARATGKTMTALNAAHSYAFIDDAAIQQLLEIAPHSVLNGETPRLLDEWQLAPELWNMVRRAVDTRAKNGQFILTGSAVPTDDITRHTGAGRFLRLRQRTMTWFEKLETSHHAVSISKLFDGDVPESDLTSALSLEEVTRNLLQPGFPAMVALTSDQAADRLRAYVGEVAHTDIARIAEVRHEPDLIVQLITSLARSVASDVTYRTLAADVRILAPSISEKTVSGYVELLQRLFIIEPQLPWTPKLRSRARLRTAPKLHLVDSALAAAVLGASEKRLLHDPQTLGVLFESTVVHDLMVFAAALNGEVRHYRDSNGKEIDAIITLPDGRWGAVEIKLGQRQIPSGAQSLSNAVDQIDTDLVGEPEFRLVVTGMGPVLRLDDGTLTAPLSALAP